MLRWEEARLAAVEAYAEARLDVGEHRELVGELGELVARHPYRERLRAAQMRALYRAGRAGEALDSFQDLRHRLADELGLDPSPVLATLHEAILAGDPAEGPPALTTPQVKPTTNLPAPVTDLVGREQAVQRVRELLVAGRLVTLTGPGGVGKTSVAVAVARALVEAYPDGVWLVDLTSWDSSGDPAEPILSALSIPDASGNAESGEQQLAAALRERHVLLVLDNCEHVVEPVATLVGALLRAAPELRVLATSREPLRLHGEQRWELPPLDVPDTDDPERLKLSAAVQLFVSRSGLASTSDTVARAAQVCRRLDGIPLALELAATRASTLGVAELAERLQVPDGRFTLLGRGPRDAPPRQRTLAAVIEWSWRLLTGREQVVLRRLAVHAGGCTLAAAEAVCVANGLKIGTSEASAVDDRRGEPGATDGSSGPGSSGPGSSGLGSSGPGSSGSGGSGHVVDVVDILAGLVDRSLVRQEGPRFRLLESVAAYCLDRLREAGEERQLRRCHADYYLKLVEEATIQLRGSGQRDWLPRLDAEAANLRAALDTFCREGAADEALRLATAASWYWFLRGRLTEARRALAEALEVSGVLPAVPGAAAEAMADPSARGDVRAASGNASTVPGEVRAASGNASAAWRARALAWHTGLAIRQGQAGPEQATAVLQVCLQDAHPLDRAWAEWFLAGPITDVGDEKAAAQFVERAVATFRQAGDQWGEAAALSTRAMLAHIRGDLATLERDARRSADLFGRLGDEWGVLQATDWLIGLADLTGDHAEAHRLSRDGLRVAEDLGLWSDVAGRLGWLAWLSVQAGEYTQALEYAEQVRRLAIEQGQRTGQVFAAISLGFAARRSGDLDRAEEHLRWLLATARQHDGDGHPPYLSMVLVELGFLAGMRGDPVTALDWHQQGFDVFSEQGSASGMAWAVVGLAAAVHLEGRHALAAELLGAAQAAMRASGQSLSASDRAEYDQIVAAVELVEPNVAALFARGGKLDLAEARSLVDRERASG